MAISKVLFSSNSDEWATPSEVYEQLNNEFNFNLDVCATEENHKCENYFTPELNGLSHKWGGGGDASATRHIHRLVSGLRRHIMRASSRTLSSSYSYQPEPIRNTFMSTYNTGPKCDLLKAVSSSATPKTRHHSRAWSLFIALAV